MTILEGYETFVEDINKSFAEVNIGSHELAMLDHLCYRVETDARYSELKEQLTNTAMFLGEAIVGGRPISTFEFATPLLAHGWRIPYLELPAPKEGSPYPEGIEHAEFVVIGGLEKFLNLHEHLPFEMKGMNKKLNPELGLKLDNVAVKFHEQPLGAVVRIEQRLGLS